MKKTKDFFNRVYNVVYDNVKPLFNGVKKFIYENERILRAVSIAIVFTAALAVSVLATGLTFGVEVIYGGKDAGVIKSAKEFDSAKSVAVSSINGADYKNFDFKDVDFRPVLTLKNRISSKDEIAEVIINGNDDIVYATEVFVNGESVICIDNFNVKEYLETCLSKYDIAGAKNTHEFIDNVEVKQGYYLQCNTSNVNDAVAVLNGLKVKTTSVVTKEVTVPYSTVTKKTSMQYVGYSSVITAGVKGLNRRVENIVTLNGVTTSNSIVSNEVLRKPVNEVVLIGTKSKALSAADKATIANAGFLFPLPSGSYVVTSYYGDGRNHQGVDLGANKGTSIFAVKGGTVVSSGSNGAYGYCVIIDHGNGVKTLYAHASKLLVSKGERVSAGQVVALVGTTGRSSGNHLHFEVIINGRNVNPAPYINLR
ncbi:MAG: peptidoglycan DD-metalloendopeptidase family protein [Clostridia bacterium]|nr:peptidoglycan DD-metalloendopeptidase family protein [Clostridia bacterium]